MSKLAFVASAYSDGILLAGSYGAASVTTYSLTQKLASTASMFVNKVGGVLIPGFTELFAGQEIARLQPVVVRLTRLLTRIGFLNLLLILILNERFVGIWVGPATFGGLALTALFAYSVFRNGLIRNLAALFFSSGRLEGWGWLSLIEAIVKISLTLVFLPTLGLLAPMIGTIIAELFTGVYTPIRVAQLVRLPLSSLLTQGIGLPLLKSVPTIVVLGVLNYLVPLQSRWFGIVFIGFCGVLANTLSFDWAQWKNGWSRLMRVMSSKPRRSVDH
jgi:O-antigen/teichoic acid export membrane protein